MCRAYHSLPHIHGHDMVFGVMDYTALELNDHLPAPADASITMLV